MKKITLTLSLCITAIMSFGQAFITFDAPNSNNATTQVRAPNGTSSHTTMRGVFHITAAEMTVSTPTANLNSFGFNLTNGVTGAPVTGSIIVYFQHTADLTNLKSTTWATAITGMTTVYNSTMSIPVTAANTPTVIDLVLASAFSYTGGNFYVAYDWISAGPFTASTTPATYAANNSIAAPAGLTAASATSVAPTTLGGTAFRPAFRFGYVNPLTNDVSINYIASPAILATSNGTSHAVQALIRNNSNTSLNNIPVSLNVSGAVSFANTFTVATLAAGNTASITFGPFPITSGLTGINTINVSVPSDQNNTNNLKSWTQTLTCNVQATGPDVTAATFTNGIGFNTGSGLLLNRMNFAGTNTLVSVDVAISSPTTNLNNNVYAVICNSLGTILATSNTITVGNANLGVYNNFTFAPTPVIAAIDYYIGLAQTSNTLLGYFPVASIPSSTSMVTPSLTLYSSAITGGLPAAQNPNLGFLGIKANLQGTCTAITPTANFISPSQICTGSSVTFTNTSVNANSYTWTATNATPNTSNAGNAVFSFSAAGTQSVSLIASGNTGSATVTYTVNVGATPILTISAPSSICAGASATLAASGASNYVWNPGNIATSSIVATPTALTIYTVTGSIGSCSTTLFHTINITPAFTVNVSASSTSICPSTSATLTASGATTYTWLPGNLNGSSISVSPANPATYTVIGTNSSCNSNTTISIGIASNPTITVQSTSTILCNGSTASLTANGATTYTWSTNANGNTIAVSPTATTIYTVTGVNASGCIANSVFTQSVSPCLGIANLNLTESIAVYPNPASLDFVIELPGTFAYTIFDALGKKVVGNGINQNSVKVNTRNFTKGLYFIEIEKDSQKTIKKIVVE